MKAKPYVVTEYYYPKSEHFDDVMNILIEKADDKDGNVYVDTIISPSYTSAIALVAKNAAPKIAPAAIALYLLCVSCNC